MNRSCLLKLLACFFAAIITPAISGQEVEAPKDAFSDAFREALFAEEAENDLETAIEGYRKVIDQFSDLRKIGASAVFRLGECYRKQGKTEEAAAQYRWLLAEFPEAEVEALAKLSRENLAAMGIEVPAGGAGRGKVFSGDPEVIEIERLRKLFATSPDRVREFPTPLYTAAEKNQLKVAAFLIEQKVDLSRGITGYTPLAAAAAEGNLKMVELLLKAGADIDGKPHSSPLVIAIQRDRELVVRTLIEGGADVNGNGRGGPLTMAMTRGESLETFTVPRVWDETRHLKYVKLLVEAGAELSRVGAAGRGTPLSIAVSRGFRDVTTFLLENGADPNVVGKASSSPSISDRSPLYLAVQISNAAMVEQLLEKGADPNLIAKQTEASPLLLAVRKGDVAMVEQLLKSGADPNRMLNDRGLSAFSGVLHLDDDPPTQEKLLDVLVKAGGDLLAGEGAVLRYNLKYSDSERLRARMAEWALRSISSDDLAGRVWTTQDLPSYPGRRPDSSNQRRRTVLPSLGGNSQPKETDAASEIPERIEHFGKLHEGFRESEFRIAPPSLAELLMKRNSWDTGVRAIDDLSGIRILRRPPDAKDGEFEEIPVNLLEKPVNPQLEWGDIVEIPRGQPWSFADPIGDFLIEATVTAVTLRIGGRDSKVRLWPVAGTNLTWVPGDALFVSRFTFDQLAEAALLEKRYDLDLGSAKIRRSLGEKEIVVDVSLGDEKTESIPILDGDVIEISVQDLESPEMIARRKGSLWLARPEENYLVPIRKNDLGVRDWSEISLIDVLASHYGSAIGTVLPHPDFAKIRVREISENGETVSEYNLADLPSDNLGLSAGAIIEIPAVSGKDAANWEGLSDKWEDFLDARTRAKIILEPEGFESRDVELGYSFYALKRGRFGWSNLGAPHKPASTNLRGFSGPFLSNLFRGHLSSDEGIRWETQGVTVIRGESEIRASTHVGGRLRDGDRVRVKRKL